jgi:predicted small lipoprotein YifL
MKRKIFILTIIAVALTALAGCGQNNSASNPPADMTTNTSTGGQNAVPAMPTPPVMPATNSVGTNAPSNP